MANQSSRNVSLRIADCGLRSTQSSRSSENKIISAFSAFSAVIVVIFMAVVAALAQPSDRERAEALARRAADRMIALQREADQLASTESTLLGDLRKLEIDRELKSGELKRADAEVAKVQADLDDTAAKADKLESEAAAERPELRARGSWKSTNWDRRATCACCSPRPTSGASAARRARSRR